MSIYIKRKEISSVFYKNKIITSIYKGTRLIWEAINSCFGKGFWINTKAWNNKDGWKNK